MKVISVVSVFFLTAWAVSGNPLDQLKDSRRLDSNFVRQEREVPVNYELVGCYRLKTLKIFGKKAYKKTKATSGTPLDQCVPEAKKNNYAIIGIQKIKKNIICREGDEKEWKPDADVGKLDHKECENDVGTKKSIFIYKKSRNPGINQQCTFEDKLYNEGEEVEKYNKTDDVCSVCKCSQGEFRDSNCYKYMCETGFLKCEEVIHPPDHCCPICKPSNRRCNGRKKGQNWLEHKNKNCLFCECLSDDKAFCKKVVTHCPEVSCKDPVIPEGSCCPYCEPETTAQQSFTFKPTEERPTPDFPFPF